MYLCYIDETGNRDPRLTIPRKDGSIAEGDAVYVLTAVTLYEHYWHGFEKTLNRYKTKLMKSVFHTHNICLQLADCEIKSNWLRIPKERHQHPFLQHLNDHELKTLTNLFYKQLFYNKMFVFSVVVDKRCLQPYMDQEKVHRKSWELLLEVLEKYMRERHNRHQAIMITDDVSKQMNQNLAMKHAHILDQGTYQQLWLKHICEMPLFVRSELSNGVQLADLCSYNIYRVFKDQDLTYPYFQEMSDRIWSRNACTKIPFSGIYIFDNKSDLLPLWDTFEKERATKFPW